MVKVFNASDREKKGGKEKQLLVSCEGHESLYKNKVNTHFFDIIKYCVLLCFIQQFKDNTYRHIYPYSDANCQYISLLRPFLYLKKELKEKCFVLKILLESKTIYRLQYDFLL